AGGVSSGRRWSCSAQGRGGCLSGTRAGGTPTCSRRTIRAGELKLRQVDVEGVAIEVLTAGEFLVLRIESRTAALASDRPPRWGSPASLVWPDYARFWSQLVDTLGG